MGTLPAGGVVSAVRRRFAWLGVLLLLVALAVTMAGIFPFRQIIAADRQVASTEEKLAALESENRVLEEAVARLDTDEEIERLARERFGLVREGEVGYVVEWVEVEPAPEPTLPPVDERSFWERAWDFLTGADAAAGG